MRLLVLGGGVSGKAAARLASRLGHSVTVYDADPRVVESVRAEGWAAAGGAWDPELLGGVDAVITSPGVPERAEPITDAVESAVAVWSEIEFAARHLDAPMIAVTGTNGKTTVTDLSARMGIAGGLRAVAAGNIGLALSDVVGGEWDLVVVEASSFQLRFIDTFRPAISVLLNVAPDHLDWHGSFSAYAAAKARIFERQDPEGVVVYDADDPEATRLVAHRPGAVPVSGRRRPEGGWGVDGERLILPELSVPLQRLPVSDVTFLADLTAAAVAASAAGVPTEGIEEALIEFRRPSHRRTLVATIGGVEWVDDSKATNPHAAVAAARAYESVVLIAGGRNKGLDLGPLARVETLRHLIVLGESATDLARSATAPVTKVETMDEAVAAARALAEPGDTVLLAPGCASFDMFDSYAARGDAFVAAVEKEVGR